MAPSPFAAQGDSGILSELCGGMAVAAVRRRSSTWPTGRRRLGLEEFLGQAGGAAATNWAIVFFMLGVVGFFVDEAQYEADDGYAGAWLEWKMAVAT